MTTRGELERGTRLGKYEIHGRLSVGGMAELYLASLAGQGGFRKFVALKRVLPAIAENEDFVKMFLDEARITASLSHAGIAQVFELAEDPDTHEPMLAMEFVAGQNLAQVIRRAQARKVPIPPEFICRLANDVLLALHYAHGFVEPSTGKPMAVVHRDINPRNVMVTYAGGTKIIDFGIAKARGRLNETNVGFVKGTLQYMAPEQVTSKGIDGRTDLFAASILFYELLTGKHLFDENSPAANMSRIATGSVPHLGEVAPSVAPAVVEAVMKGLQRDPALRWQNGREYARAIDRAMPDSFDEQQMAEFMASLFEDKIAVTRELLSAAETASPSDLRLMTMMGEEEAPRELASDMVSLGETPDVPTALARSLKDPVRTVEPPTTERTEMNLQAVPEVRKTEPANQPTIASLPAVAEPTTIAAVAVVKKPAAKPRSRPELPKSEEAEPSEPSTDDQKPEWWLYAVLAVLALALVGGAIALFADKAPEETRPIEPLRKR
ncbi:MAG: serine/threonine-protein kinase [Archangium sp.]|nr:serine/threonine-protein kinase [Archangium sp.]